MGATNPHFSLSTKENIEAAVGKDFSKIAPSGNYLERKLSIKTIERKPFQVLVSFFLTRGDK
jgi:hypothetical protein